MFWYYTKGGKKESLNYYSQFVFEKSNLQKCLIFNNYGLSIELVTSGSDERIQLARTVPETKTHSTFTQL